MFSSNLMLRPNLHNRTFDWMGDTYGPFIDAGHFLGHSSLGTPWRKEIPLANIKHADGESIFEIAVPGFSKDDITVAFVNDVLTISGHRNTETADDTTYISKEFEMRPFDVKFRMRVPLDLESVRAEYTNGMLRLFFKEVKEAKESQARLINVS